MFKSKVGFILAIVFAFVVVGGSFVFSKMQKTDNYLTNLILGEKKQEVDLSASGFLNETDHIRGNVNAEISIIEYSDFECSFCARFHSTALELLETYEGDVNWVYRHFPLDWHEPMATKKAQASECAAYVGSNDDFWKYADSLFVGFSQDLRQIAKEIEIDDYNHTQCFNDDRFREKIRNDISLGKKHGVTGTPGILVVNHRNGRKRFVGGAQHVVVFEEVIEELMR